MRRIKQYLINNTNILQLSVSLQRKYMSPHTHTHTNSCFTGGAGVEVWHIHNDAHYDTPVHEITVSLKFIVCVCLGIIMHSIISVGPKSINRTQSVNAWVNIIPVSVFRTVIFATLAPCHETPTQAEWVTTPSTLLIHLAFTDSVLSVALLASQNTRNVKWKALHCLMKWM